MKRKLEEATKKEDVAKEINLGSIKAIYRNLRENYEYRLRYDEVGNFIREMELKRKYKMTRSLDGKTEVKLNNPLQRNISLTNFYFRLGRYGENLLRPFLFGIGVISFSTLYWLIQSSPTPEPSFSYDSLTHLGSAFGNSTSVFLQLKNDDLKWQGYIIKALGIVGLGLFAISIRRFERKFRH